MEVGCKGNIREAFQCLWGGFQEDGVRLFADMHDTKTRNNRYRLEEVEEPI